MRGNVVGPPLQSGDEAVVVVPERGGPGEHRDLPLFPQGGGAVRDPGEGGLAAELAAGAEQRAPELRLIVGEDHPRARPRRRERGGKSGWTAPHHEYVGRMRCACRSGPDPNRPGARPFPAIRRIAHSYMGQAARGHMKVL